MKYLSLRNWDKYQHYKDRNPPWIKFYNSLLDDYDFSKLDDETKWHVLACTLLASRTENRIPADPKWIAARTGSTSKVNIDMLISSGMFDLFQDDTVTSVEVAQLASNMLDQSRGEEETEGEKNMCSQTLINEQFERMWFFIPKKVDKVETLAEFKKALKIDDFDTILSRVQAWQQRESGKDRQYVKSPKRWFANKHWQDEPLTPTRSEINQRKAERALM